MQATIEIEKKYRVLDNCLEPLLSKMAYISTDQIVDRYLDTSNGFYYQQGIFIRTRNAISLDIKFNPDHLRHQKVTDHVMCHEYNFPLPFHPSTESLFHSLKAIIEIKQPFPYSFENFLAENSLEPLVTLDKKRTSYENDLCLIAVDELTEFGTFIEFEAKESSADVTSFLQAIKALTEGFWLEPIHSGYVEFALRQINEPLYRKGKYLLEEAVKKDVAA